MSIREQLIEARELLSACADWFDHYNGFTTKPTYIPLMRKLLAQPIPPLGETEPVEGTAIREMVKIITDPNADDDEVHAAVATIRGFVDPTPEPEAASEESEWSEIGEKGLTATELDELASDCRVKHTPQSAADAAGGAQEQWTCDCGCMNARPNCTKCGRQASAPSRPDPEGQGYRWRRVQDGKQFNGLFLFTDDPPEIQDAEVLDGEEGITWTYIAGPISLTVLPPEPEEHELVAKLREAVEFAEGFSGANVKEALAEINARLLEKGT